MENIRISDALQILTPGAEWSIGNNSYSQLDWLDTEQTKPTEEEVVQKVAELQYQEEVNEYQRQRAAEYPSYPDQFDKIYHSGVAAWKTQIKTIKDKYPKQTMDATELQTRQDKSIFDLQKERYIKATERLSQYILSVGREEITEEVIVSTEEVWNEETEEYDTVNTTETVITQTAIEPLEETVEVTTYNEETEESTTSTVRNPLIVKDEEERAAAQVVVDATPQQVKDSA
jgi:hypothetical protein